MYSLGNYLKSMPKLMHQVSIVVINCIICVCANMYLFHNLEPSISAGHVQSEFIESSSDAISEYQDRYPWWRTDEVSYQIYKPCIKI